MIDPSQVTKYDRTQAELEEFLLFCCAVAGKSAKSAARALDRYLGPLRDVDRSAFECVRYDLERRDVPLYKLLKHAGFGCYFQRAKTFEALAYSGLDLKTCSREELQAIPGIGPKTASFFLLHSRQGWRGAVLDRHILSFLRDQYGVDAPKSTPQSSKVYRDLEEIFLMTVPPWSTPAQHDLEIWKEYSDAGR
jgi:thermostable 8-oxoguanine DNA glycosylase